MAFNVGAGAGGRRPIGATLAEINIIPLVDVVLVLLLIFMLTAPMMYRGIDVTLPKTASKPTAVEERLVLTVTRERRLYLKADAGLSYGDVIDTMDRVRRAGVERLGMVTAPAPLPPPR